LATAWWTGNEDGAQMIGTTVPKQSATSVDGMRPVNLRTDLAPLADLMETVFAGSMDSSGRSAIGEMRALSKLGVGLGLLARINELALGVRLGYVWIADGKLVGNVSVYPGNWPSDLGSTWIIANVGVQADYRRRGIARRLMQASLDMIQARGGRRAILQVDYDNIAARNLYESLGFVNERAWITWRRSHSLRPSPPLTDTPAFITSRAGRNSNRYASRTSRPVERGGMGWQRPLHRDLFRKSLLRRILDWLSLRSVERLVIHAEDGQSIVASLWIEAGLVIGNVELTLIVELAYQGLYDDALIGTAVRRFAGHTLVIEHPMDETAPTDSRALSVHPGAV
jgi:ribosomal protein S18 acetylase RimI-like enzyme